MSEKSADLMTVPDYRRINVIHSHGFFLRHPYDTAGYNPTLSATDPSAALRLLCVDN